MPAAAEKSSAGSMVSFETALTSTVCLHEPSKPPVVPNGHTRSPPNHSFSPTLSPKPCLKRDIQPNQKKLEDFARSGSHQGSVLSPQMYTMETERHKPGSRRPRRRLIFRLCLAMVLATVAVLVVWILYRSVFFSSDDPVVRGRFGAVRGVRINVKDGNTLISLHAFYAIPYAKAPVGALRFRKPSGWSHHFIDPNFNDGNATSEKVKNAREYDLDVIDCTEKRGPCPQNGFLYGNRNVKLENWTEDCLHINIWAPPADCSNRHVKCGNNTVLFFLHGGSFQNGGNSLEFYDGRYLAALGDMVVVVPNYRLGVFGFFWSDDTTDKIPSNVGLEDQALALSWTLDNIGYFGGDSQKLVLAGYEAGATALGFHMYSGPSSIWTTSARRFILLSGGPFRKYRTTHGTLAAELARELSCPDDLRRSEALNCLKMTSAAIILSKTPAFWPMFQYPPVERTVGELLNKIPEGVGPYKKEVLLSRTVHEGFLRAYELYGTSEKELWVSPLNTAKQVLLPVFGSHHWMQAFGPGFNADHVTCVRANAAVTRALGTCPMHFLADKAYFSKNTVYGFVLGNLRNYTAWFDKMSDIVSFEELYFVFGMPLKPGLSSTHEDKIYSRSMIRMLSTFAKEGVPFLGNTPLPKYVPQSMFPFIGAHGVAQEEEFSDIAMCHQIKDMYKA